MGKSKIPQTIGGVGIFALVGLVVLFLVAMPSIEISGYYNPEPKNTWNSKQFDLSINKINNDGFYQHTNVCFRIDNTAENVLPSIIAANNFRVQINTEIECEQCGIFDDMDWIEGQDERNTCRKMAVAQNTEQISLEVVSSWTTLKIPFSNQVTFSCNAIDETNSKIDFTCMRS